MNAVEEWALKYKREARVDPIAELNRIAPYFSRKEGGGGGVNVASLLLVPYNRENILVMDSLNLVRDVDVHFNRYVMLESGWPPSLLLSIHPSLLPSLPSLFLLRSLSCSPRSN